MSVLGVFRDLDRKFAWSFFGFLLAFIFGLVTVYDRFLTDKNPQLNLDVLTNTAVLDIKEDLPTLAILFDGINIRQQNLSLRLISVKVVNESSRDILKGFYDSEDPIGLQVFPGKIIRADIVETSNDYLAKSTTLIHTSDTAVYFKDVIIEANQYFVVKLLVLHPADIPPSIKSAGHIAGMKEIRVREPYKEVGKVKFWAAAFSGVWYIQVVRLFAYFLLGVLLILAIVLPVSFAEDRMVKYRKKSIVRQFKDTRKGELNRDDEYIFNEYIKRGGINILLAMQELEKNQDYFRAVCLASLPKYKGPTHKEILDYETDLRVELEHQPFLPLIGELVDAGFIIIRGDEPSIDPHMKDTLGLFLAFLKKKNPGMFWTDDSPL